jgi:hypothetical protein
MQLFINNTDITDTDQSVRSCKYKDFAGGHADVLQIVFNDTFDLWRTWDLNKNDPIRAVKNKVDSGTMYVSNISISNGAYTIKALSTPAKALGEKSSIKERIKLTEICKDISNELGFELQTYEINDYLYEYVERVNQNPVSHLESILMREGYLQKIYNNKLIVYSERVLERVNPSINLEIEDFITDPELSTSDTNLVSVVENLYNHENGFIKNKVSSELNGKKLNLNMPVSSIGEGERFCNSIMRYYNKYEYTGSGQIENDNITAGTTINLVGNFSSWSGINFVYEVTHDLISGKKYIKFRKPIEGGY